jgi:DNA polymerase-3 subunit epsilon
VYAIVDIETTGSSANYGRITEVAILIHDGNRVIDEFQTLINPEQSIPSGITTLTGISNEMVAEAPRFFEVAKDIHLMLAGNTFVAHNVNFDYSFLKKEFQSLGAEFNHKKLCTVRLSRKVFPGLKSYSLGRLCEHFGIENQARHRAMGDARATAILMDRLIAEDDGHIEQFLKRNSKEADLPPNLAKSIFEQLPNETGVYYFLDAKGKVLYVGKANDIKKRIRGHFSSTDVVFKQGLKDQIHDINYELCGDEMIAFLFESYEIKRLFPPFNNALKFPRRQYGLFHYLDGNGNHRLTVGKVQKGLRPLARYASFDRARNALIALVKEYQLDPERCALPAESLKYFGYAFEAVDLKQLNERFESALQSFQAEMETFVIEGKGRSHQELSLVLVEKGIYKGYGFVRKSEQLSSLEEIKDRITIMPDNPDARSIIDQFKEKRSFVELN